MKKLLGVLILGLLSCNISFANDNRLEDFNQWLLKNEHTQYLEIKKDFEECKDCTRWDAGPECFEEIGKPKKQCVLNGDQSYGEGGYKWVENFKHKNNLDIRFYKSSEIPWEAKPNKDTLLYYLFRYLDVEDGYDRAGSKGTKTPHKFKTELRDDKIQKYVNKHMQKTALLSYLLYEDGKITIDEISPKDRFGILYNNNTQFTSASVGKSLVSYVTGHAICEGYIDSVDARINDWPLLENTLFYDQKLIDLLNMAAGHHKYADFDLKTNKYNKNGNANTVEFHMQKGVFKNSKKTTKEFEDPAYNPSKEYGGYFHMGYSGLKKRAVFGMSGYGGNSILIDPETSTITVINSLHYRSKSSSKYHYNEKKLSIKPIKNRKKSK
ncbi:hypothetical protein N8825_00240 [Candidatus Pelagibacter ubique]|nr:hypothetical protein [Candidatus Pelagibacter ubique]